MGIQTILCSADRAIGAEAQATANNLAAWRALVDVLRPTVSALAGDRYIVTGRSEWEGDDPYTLDTIPGMVLSYNYERLDEGPGCGETKGYLVGMRADGTLVASETSGRYWSGRGGGSLWACEALCPVTIEAVADRVDADDAARQTARELDRRTENAEARSARLTALLAALAGVP